MGEPQSDVERHGALREGALVGGRFRVERLIGRGGMGEVYAACHTTTGKEVALKLVHATAGAGKERVRRFMREARAATAIQHPNVIEVFDVFEDTDGTPVMVMELLKGEPFSRYRERLGALTLHQAAAVLLPVSSALRAAHEKGIVHRDLKPDNVFLASGSGDRAAPAGFTVKVLDFGIAKVLDPTKIGSETQGQNTNTGSILGTPHYMSYEQAMSDKLVDHRSDIWSIGVMLFEALTGRRPMTYDTLGQMYASLLQGTVPAIREFVPDLPDDVARVLDGCLAKLPDDRLASLEPLVTVLGKYLDPAVPGAQTGGRVLAAPVQAAAAAPTGTTASVFASESRPSTKARSRGAVVAIGSLGLVVVTAGAYALTRRPPDRPVVVVPPAAASSQPTGSPLPETPVAVAPSASTAATAVVPSVPSVRPKPADRPGPRPGPGLAASSPRTTATVEPATPKKGIPDQLPY